MSIGKRIAHRAEAVKGSAMSSSGGACAATCPAG